MHDELDLKDFSGRTPLFPLSGVVMFPHVVVPLHIFEPRYRRMTEDALDGDRLITMVRLLGDGSPRPPIEGVGCLGRIIHHERLADGRFNILLLGRSRVRLLRETTDDLPYRSAEVEVLEDVPASASEEQARAGLVEHLRRMVGAAPELLELLDRAESLGALVDVMAHALAAAADWKQRLLEETSVEARVQALHQWLRELPARRTFPPPFSDN
ncbi:LON peptidase substrate-binding domain-containing protein [Paludisphaera mucosa]|uniref:LON peptidase substrate-binding domain-containing protein n=1 Tax=Paludisphaera mucosa TaxID=3030827 RepID=A0ABT6FCT2_9BACT|nr:LON peptidase substrate-binding domain-containing protein [Paludisphaera mucosa]MDG3005376.1 LON peptidase substrate-binding domain-containing protein [Paludisphaera mucosa]